MRSRRLLTLAVVSWLAPSCGRQHLQDAGSYSLVFEAIAQDNCQLYPAAGAFGVGVLQHAGDDVFIAFQPFQMNLRGEYGHDVEAFFVDGDAARVSATVNGHACTLDMVQLHLEATTDSASEFHGPARIRYQSLDDARCRCEVYGSYRAVRQ